MTDFILRGSKITADGDCSHEIKRRLLLGRKVLTVVFEDEEYGEAKMLSRRYRLIASRELVSSGSLKISLLSQVN